MAADPLPELAFESRDAFAAWLDEHHTEPAGIWLRIAKKASGIASVTYDEAVEVALCYGWIDGQKRPLDGTYWLQKFTPRRRASMWSQVNRERAERLIAEGRMTQTGLREVELARADGRWERAYESQSRATVPEDLQAALGQDADAAAFFATLSSANRYAVLYRLRAARTPEARARRLEQLIAMLRERRTFH